MASAVLWGAVGISALLLGMVLAMLRSWSDRLIGLVLGFGAGALIAAIGFELYQDAVDSGGHVTVGIALAVGALTYFVANGLLTAWANGKSPLHAAPGGRGPSDNRPSDDEGRRHRPPSMSAAGPGAAGVPLALGALLDGIPEQTVLGISYATTGAVNPAMLIAVFVSNLPEAIGSSADMLEAGRPRRFVALVWLAVVAVCVGSTVLGYWLADRVGDVASAAINSFAAGALLVMLIDSMIPEARHKAGNFAGLATTLGFAVVAGISLG